MSRPLQNALAPEGYTPAQLALRWIIQQPRVTMVIPGARSAEQVHANAAIGKLPALFDRTLTAILDLYDRRIKEQTEGCWQDPAVSTVAGAVNHTA